MANTCVSVGSAIAIGSANKPCGVKLDQMDYLSVIH